MAVLILIVGLLSQLVAHTSSSVVRSTKGMDNIQLATLALDRVGNSITGMVTSGTGTLVAYKNSNGSDGLAMLTNTRVRSRARGSGANTNDSNIYVGSFTDIRMGTRGFCVIDTADPDLPTSPSIPMLNWGDGTVVWSTTNNAPTVQGDPTTALSKAAQDVVSPPSGGASGTMLDFSPLSRSIFRFELAFSLSDGTMVNGLSGSPPPRNKYFIANGAFTNAPVSFPAGTYPLAFSAETSDTTNASGQSVYVRAVVVGIVSLDATTQKLLSGAQLKQLASNDTFPKAASGQTPAQTWDITNQNGTVYTKIAPPNYPAPVLQNIRVTQRYYYVN
ncbi:MAG: hypothetical protein INR62_01600 [Rhodospirillales bacterium]|nr:hypothetical protein [Acetobacter sp.]